jgi:hypothetical protein
MKLVRLSLGREIHKASRQGAIWMGQKIPTAACNPKKAFFDLAGHYSEFEGDVSQVTCKKCNPGLKK